MIFIVHCCCISLLNNRYMNPIPIIIGYWTNSFKLFLIITVIAYLLLSRSIAIQKGMIEIEKLKQMEFNYVQRICQERSREQKTRAAQDFTNRLVSDFKMIKKNFNPKRETNTLFH